jgi:glucose/arabinose dehydrogenase
MEDPVHVWVPSTGVSGLMLYTGDRFPDWRGSLFAGGLSGERISRLTMDGQKVVLEETLLHRMGRVRDVRQGPDGYIYVAIDGNERGDKTPIYRLEPADGSRTSESTGDVGTEIRASAR